MSFASNGTGRNGSGPRAGAGIPRVLQVGKFYPPEMGGMETHLEILSRGLRDHMDVRVLVSSREKTHQVESVKRIAVTRLGTAWNFAGAPISPAMISRIRKARADIVHLHLPNPAAILAYLASGTRARLVVSYHSDVVRQRALDIAFRPFLLSTLKRADAIIAATPNYIDSSPVLSKYRERCSVVPYGIPLDGFAHSEEPVAELRRRFGSRIVVSVGRLVYYKGFDVLIRSMKAVDGHLVIVGDGPMRGHLERLAQSIGVAERVTFTGGVRDVVPYCHLADVFVLASVARSEAFGIVQLEAMACGKPVVNTNLDSGVPYVSVGGETGLTVPPGDPAALAGAVESLLNDPTLRESYGRAARARVEAEFSMQRMIERTVAVYAGILGRSDLRIPSAERQPCHGSARAALAESRGGRRARAR